MTNKKIEVPFIVTPRGVTVFGNGKTYTANKDHINHAKIIEALKNGVNNFTVLENLFDVPKALTAQSGGRVTVRDGEVYYDGKPIHSTLSKRILTHLGEGFDITSMVKFMEKLYNNPSYRSVQCLYDFLEANNIPLTPEGNFLTFKKVREDYLDYYTGTMDNSIGKIVRMARNQVNEDPEITCSYGLHVCAEHYLRSYHGSQGRVVICEVNPGDVVAVPKDYNNAKMRVAGYTVVGEVPEADAAKYFHSAVIDPSRGFHLLEGEDDWGDYYDADAELEYDGTIEPHVDSAALPKEIITPGGKKITDVERDPNGEIDKFIYNVEGHVVTFVLRHDGFDAEFVDAAGDYNEYESESDDVDEAISGFLDSVPETRNEYTVSLRALDEDGDLVEDAIIVLAEDSDDAEYNARERFMEEHDIDSEDEVKIRNVTQGAEYTVLVW